MQLTDSVRFFRFVLIPTAVLSLVTFDANASTVTHEIDFFVIGDDETVTASFENDFPPADPMQLWFDGFAENLEAIGNNGILTVSRR